MRKISQRVRIAATAAEGLDLRASGAPTPGTLYAVGEPVILVAAAEEGSLPTFKGAAYNGGAMRPMGFFRDVYVDLAGAQIAPGNRPIHRDHRPDKVVGHTTEIKVDGRRITCAGVISGTGPDAAEVRDNGKNQFPWRLSIGARIIAMSYIDSGEKFECNGKTHTAPEGGCYVVRSCLIYEISFVSLAGDDTTSVTVSATSQGSEKMKFGAWLAARGHDINALTAQQLAELRAAYDTETHPGDPRPPANPKSPTNPAADPPGKVTAGAGDNNPTDPKPPTNPASVRIDAAATRAELAAEIERAAKVKAICARYGDPEITVDDQQVSLHAHAVREGWNEDKVELEAMRASRPTAGTGIHTIDRTATAAVVEASLCMSAGMKEDDLKGAYDDKTMEAALSRSHRGIGLQQLICGFILAHGGHATPGRFDDDTIRSAFEIQRNLRAGGTSSSSYSLPGILSNVANKAMQAAYRAVPDVLSQIAHYRSVNDFKTTSVYQLSSSGEFAKIGADGELKHGSLKESSYTNRAETRGQVIMLTREHMRNDDLGAFVRVPMAIARKGATELQKVGFGVLEGAGAAAFFSSGHGNYIEGAGKDLSIDTLTELVTLMEEQVDEGGDPIGVTPVILLTASKNKVLGRQLHDETKIVSGAAGKTLASNPHAGLYRPESTPFLTQNKDAVYLFADPADIPALEAVFLDGRQQPIVEAGELDFTHLGVAYRGYYDFGVAFADHRGAVKSKGKA